MATFRVQKEQLIYDDKPVTLISGAVHYYRIVPEYWRDRLYKLKACGFNTVETYIPWNVHEPEEGKFNFEGLADVEQFIEIAQDLDLLVIVRPSPYICAEWEFGGLPAWLLRYEDMQLRCYDKRFLEKVDAYYDVLLPKLKPWLCTNGGPVIALQIENEYGSYGNDQRYLRHLKESMVQRGMDVLLCTSDGPTDAMLQGGTMPDEWATVNFGSGEKEAFQKLVEYQPDQPLMCMEFWNGWFDHWGGKHHTRPAEDMAAVFENMLSMGASVNFYMFHGGTNFGFYNGANCLEKYEPTITSYDYDTLLNEWGAPTDKYFAVQKVLSTYGHRDPLPLPEPVRPKRYGPVRMTEKGLLRDALLHISAPVSSTTPLPMEKYGQNYGFILYSTHVQGPRQAEKLIIQDVWDRALVFVNEEYAGVLERWGSDSSLTVNIPPEGATITLLVENMGRVNYGPHLRDPKGITEGVRLGNQFLYHWNVYPLPLTNLADLPFRSFSAAEEASPKTDRAEECSCPTFYKGELHVDEPADTFVDLSGWTKGVVLVNGFNIGRYWCVGPQQTLYLPGPLLKEGRNEIVVFELHGVDVPDGQQLPQISLQDEHVLGPNHVQKADQPVGNPKS